MIYWQMWLKQDKLMRLFGGVRTTMDFEYESQLAHLNRLLTNGVESLFLPPTEQWSYVSSTIVRDIFLHQGDVSRLVPAAVLRALEKG